MLQYDSKIISEIHNQDSRGIVGYTLGKLRRENNKIVAVYADVGSRFGLIQAMGEQGIQASIAEQSLISVLSGLAHEGFIPYGVAYAPFITMRAADQIRMSVGAMGLGIKIVGGSAGLVSGNLGAASMALDDIALMRAIPNMIVLAPADCLEAAKMLDKVSQIEQPVYIRLTGANHLSVIYDRDFQYEIGRSNIVAQNGKDVVIYAIGMQVAASVRAMELLKEHGIGCIVVDMHTIKPIDQEILERFSSVPLAVSVEEHNITGGLGSAIAEYLSSGSGQYLLRIGIRDIYPEPDSYPALLQEYDLTPERIAGKIIKSLQD